MATSGKLKPTDVVSSPQNPDGECAEKVPGLFPADEESSPTEETDTAAHITESGTSPHARPSPSASINGRQIIIACTLLGLILVAGMTAYLAMRSPTSKSPSLPGASHAAQDDAPAPGPAAPMKNGPEKPDSLHQEVKAARKAEAPRIAPSPHRVLLLRRPPPPTDMAIGKMFGILQRELVRQALLIAARDGLGLATRDAALREPPPDDLPANCQFLIDTAFETKKNAHLTLARGAAEAPEELLVLDGCACGIGSSLDYVQLLEYAESLSRKEFVAALTKAGFAGKPNNVSEETAVPEGVETLSARLTFASQFAALRELHAAIRAQGESRRLLGALARAYTNLGVLTETHWGAGHKVFKARALLYAQRLVATQPASPWGLWHRAYALALTGFHQAALTDLASAARLAALSKDSQQPAWVPLIEALCRFDTRKLAAVPADKPEAQLAGLLHYITVEDPRSPGYSLETAQRVLATNPECYRMHDSIAAIGDVANLHQTTLAGMKVMNETLSRRLSAMPQFPGPIQKELDRGAPEVDIYRALVRAGRDDTTEPSWSILRWLVQEQRFTQVRRRLNFMRNLWVVPVDDFLAEVVPLLEDHPGLPFVKGYSSEQRARPDFLPSILELTLSDFDVNHLELIRMVVQSYLEWQQDRQKKSRLCSLFRPGRCV